MSRVVIVTGAESGIGRACAAAFGALGDKVAIFYHSDTAGADETAQAVKQAHGDAITVQCSVNDEASVDAAYAATVKAFGAPSVLVNSAGLNMSGVNVRDMALAQWQRLLDTDLTGAFLTSRRFLTTRDTANPGSIVHISSIHAYAVRAGGADYCAAKGGLSNLIETMAIEEAPNGIRVNSVEPGMILTPMNEKASTDPVYRKTLECNIPMGRAGQPEEVAALVRWLCSSEASYITGARMVIDGGLSLMQALSAHDRSLFSPDSVTGDRKEQVQRRVHPIDFNVEALEDVTLVGPPELMARDLMSPYVWTEPDGRCGIMVRAVVSPGNPMTDTGIIWAGWSDDGLTFHMLDRPSIVPGPSEQDIGGVEDPTVLCMDDGSYVVYYTGVAADMSHGEMFYAEGPSVDQLTKTGVALASTKSMGNTKEATVDRTQSGGWRLFYEYAADDASRVGLAIGTDVCGPWEEQPTPFMPREDSWDNWHLSTGPTLMTDTGHSIMFYNGATRDARWRIGWIAFDRDCTRVIDRCIQPLITPPPVMDRTATDIAFAASVIEQDGVWLYYSLEDRRLARARLRRS